MQTLVTLLGTLPPASLAEADLPSFLTRALNRLAPNDLEPIERLLKEEPLAGYPTPLGSVLAAVVHFMRQEDIPPQELDPEAMDEILAQASVLEQVESQVKLERFILRPGLPVSAEVRAQLLGRIREVFGVGAQLVLVAPVVVVTLPGLGWSSVRSPALAKLMYQQEADILEESWAIIEECAGWPDVQSPVWEARFVRIASRPNHDAWQCARVLRLMLPNRRTALWGLLVEHLMDQELPEAYRPGPHGLERALESARLDLEKEDAVSLLAIARHAYRTCGPNPSAEIGDFTCSKGDLHAFSKWVNVPEAIRERLLAMAPEVVEHYLRRLAAEESADLHTRMDEQLARSLRTFRDGYMRQRYSRDVRALMSVDPLTLADQWVESGKHQNRIVEDLKVLAKRAQAQQAAEQAAEAAAVEEAPLAPTDATDAEDTSTTGEETTAVSPPVSVDASEAEDTPTPLEEFTASGETSGHTELTLSDADVGAMDPEFVGEAFNTDASETDDGALHVESELPPMPVPPPARRRVMTTRPIVLPPMPKVPDCGANASATKEDIPSSPSVAAPGLKERLAGASDAKDSQLPNGQTPLFKRLVTPDQASEFYENAFRELQVLERDLLERGPRLEAKERVAVFEADAAVLMEALGPAARSGDERFAAALNKVELVCSYLESIQSIFDGPMNQEDASDEPAPDMSKPGRITKILKRNADND